MSHALAVNPGMVGAAIGMVAIVVGLIAFVAYEARTGGRRAPPSDTRPKPPQPPTEDAP